MSSKKLDAIIIFIAGLLLFTLGLSSQEIIGFESRFYLFALNMWRHGLSWFPMTYQEPYPDYPVTSTVLIYTAAKLFGGLNKLTAILPSAIAAAFTLSLTYLIGCYRSRQYGWYAVGFLLFTFAFISQGRTISLDMYITAITTFCFYLAYSAKYHHQYYHPLASYFVIALLLILGFAIRGPIGLVIPTAVLSVFYLLEKNARSFFIIASMGFLLLIISICLLLIIAYHAGGMDFVKDVLKMEVVGRMAGKAVPGYYYLTDGMLGYALAFPLASIVILTLAPKLMRFNLPEDLKFLQLLIGWVLIILIGLSIPADKKIRYVLAISPGLALISAQIFYQIKLKKLLFIFFSLILISCLILLIIFNYFILSLVWTMGLSFLFASRAIKNKSNLVFFAALALFLLNYFLIIEPIELQLNKTRDFVEQVEQLRHADQAKLVFYREGKDGLPIKYLMYMPAEDEPLFVSTVDEINKITTPVIIITEVKNASTLPDLFKRVKTGKIGHVSVWVFSKNASHPLGAS